MEWIKERLYIGLPEGGTRPECGLLPKLIVGTEEGDAKNALNILWPNQVFTVIPLDGLAQAVDENPNATVFEKGSSESWVPVDDMEIKDLRLSKENSIRLLMEASKMMEEGAEILVGPDLEILLREKDDENVQ